MKKEDILKKYINNKKLIFKYNHHYFNLDSPLVSDGQYDEIKAELIKLEKKYAFLKDHDSIQNKVGAPVTKKFKKIKHSEQMLSLSNTFDAKGMAQERLRHTKFSKIRKNRH